jgi:O-antigen ligase
MRQSSAFSTVHALATVAVGFYFALAGRKHLLRVAYVGAYIVGAEVLWRMTAAQVFWEMGKWATAAILITAMLRSGRLKGAPLVLWYFALLLPSAVLTLTALGLGEARRELSFNLSGPFSLMICCCFFANLKLRIAHLQKLFLVQIGPTLGVAAIAFYGISTATDLSFGKGSSFGTSGGFGPNQVSAALGLGALSALLILLVGKLTGRARVIVLVAMLFLAIHSALTFSRGGLYNAVAAALLGGLYFMRDAGTRARLLVLVPGVLLIVNYTVIPQLDAFTQGALSTRFKSVDTTNRNDIALAQLEVWRDHPLLGVGPGLSRYYADAVAHTELTRLPAEHGVFGLAALILLLIAGLRNLRRARTPRAKAVVASTIGWSFAFMLNAGMRLMAPSFLFGLSFLMLSEEPVPRRRRLRRVPGEPEPQNAAKRYEGVQGYSRSTAVKSIGMR